MFAAARAPTRRPPPHEHVCAAMSNIAQHRSGRVYRQQVQEGGAVGLRDFLANAMAANAVPWALEAMEKFAQHEPLQRHALSLLRSLAASEPPNAPPAAVGSRSIPPPASYDAVMLRAGSVAPVAAPGTPPAACTVPTRLSTSCTVASAISRSLLVRMIRKLLRSSSRSFFR